MSRAASAFKSSVVYSGSAIFNGVNMITPHLAGAVDILAVKQPDGTLKSTPFYVRFGKYTSYRTKDQTVKVTVNGKLTSLRMHLGSLGTAYFVTETTEVYDCSDKDDVALNGMISPPSGYSSAEDEVIYGNRKLLESVKSDIREISEKETIVFKNKNTKQNRKEIKVGLDVKNVVKNSLSNSEAPGEDGKDLANFIQSYTISKEKNFKVTEISENGLNPLLVDSLDDPDEHRKSLEKIQKKMEIYNNPLKSTDSSESNITLREVKCNGKSDTSRNASDIKIEESKEKGFVRIESCPNLEFISESQKTNSDVDTKDSFDDNEINSSFELPPPNEMDPSYSPVMKESGCKEWRKTRSEPDPEHKSSFEEITTWNEKKKEKCNMNIKIFDGYMGDSEICNLSAIRVAKEDKSREKPGGLDGLREFELSLCGHLLRREMLMEETKKVFEMYRVTMSEFEKNGVALTNNPDLVCRLGGTVYPWSAASPMVLGMLAFGGRWDNLIQAECKLPTKSTTNIDKENHHKTSIITASSGWRLWPFGVWRDIRVSKSPENEEIQIKDSSSVFSSNSEKCKFKSFDTEQAPIELMINRRANKHRIVTRKTLMPTSEQLEACSFVDGQNTIVFHIGETVNVQAYVYVMNWTSRLVISDIDGTVTKSDLLGHLLPPMGVDWTHPGVAHLLSNIKTNGYEIMYLSSRAIAQANITRDFIHGLTQGGYKMPSGPVIISPHGLLPSLYREMILRRPHDFKISTLQDVRVLFPDHWNPFYAGFGNRDTDAFSYEKSGVPLRRIFTINSKGRIILGTSTSTQTSTWSSLQSINELVDEVFPPIPNHNHNAQLREEYNDYHYWKSSSTSWMWEDDPQLLCKQEESIKSNFDSHYLEDDMLYVPGQLARSVLSD